MLECLQLSHFLIIHIPKGDAGDAHSLAHSLTHICVYTVYTLQDEDEGGVGRD